MTQFSSQSEQSLLSQVRDVQAHISGGMSPTDAVAKVAQDRRTHPDMLPLLVQSTNLGRQAYQQEKAAGGGVLGLISEYPLADLSAVRSQLYPSRPSSPLLKSAADAVSDVYDAEPQAPAPARTKQASNFSLPEPATFGDYDSRKRARAQIKVAMDRMCYDAKLAAIEARDRFVDRLDALVGYFKSAESLPVATVAIGCRSLFGKRAEAVLDMLRERVPDRPEPRSKQALAVDAKAQPYSLVQDVLTAAAACGEAEKHAAEMVAGRASRLETLYPFSASGPTSNPPAAAQGSSLLKTGSSWLQPMLTGASAGIASGMRNRFDPSALSANFENQLDDPEHLDELRGISSRAMLADLMNNDQVLQGYDPEEITNAYNELVQLSPSAADQPALMRPLLRKRLTAGSTEPFDAQQIADIEKTLQETRPPARSAHGPANPLG